MHCCIKGAHALQLEVAATHWLLAAKGEGDVDILWQAEQLPAASIASDIRTVLSCAVLQAQQADCEPCVNAGFWAVWLSDNAHHHVHAEEKNTREDSLKFVVKHVVTDSEGDCAGGVEAT